MDEKSNKNVNFPDKENGKGRYPERYHILDSTTVL
jgi:hypothetical protein